MCCFFSYCLSVTVGRLSLPSPNTSSEQVCLENDNITQRFRVCLHSNVSSFYKYLPSYCALVFLCKVSQTSDHHHHHHLNIVIIILFNIKSAGWCSRLPTTFRLLCWKKRKPFHLHHRPHHSFGKKKPSPYLSNIIFERRL